MSSIIAPTRGGGAGGKMGSGSSERMVSQLLTEMDGIQKEIHGVVVLAATNRVDMIDTALLRPGRFDKILLVPKPDVNTRRKILEIHIKGMTVIRSIHLNCVL